MDPGSCRRAGSLSCDGAPLVARPGLGKRLRCVPVRHLELDRPRVPAQCRIHVVSRSLVAHDDRAGVAAGASAADRPCPLRLRSRPPRQRDRARKARRARTCGHVASASPRCATRDERHARRNGLRAPRLRPRACDHPRGLGSADGGGAALGRRRVRDRRLCRLRAFHHRLDGCSPPQPVGHERRRRHVQKFPSSWLDKACRC